MLGESEKKIQDEEKQTKLIARKSLVASKDLKKGHVLKLDDILIKRPGSRYITNENIRSNWFKFDKRC